MLVGCSTDVVVAIRAAPYTYRSYACSAVSENNACTATQTGAGNLPRRSIEKLPRGFAQSGFRRQHKTIADHVERRDNRCALRRDRDARVGILSGRVAFLRFRFGQYA